MAETSRRLLLIASMCAGLLFSLLVNGALPGLASPTLGQAIWTVGFSQSFLNESMLNIYAHNIGAPQPAAIAFGLAGAWVTGVFLTVGLAPPDAYAAMVAVWLSVAFASAYGIARYLGGSRIIAILGAVTWTTMPAIWGHAGYSMVSLGIALLPLYFLSALRLFRPNAGTADSPSLTAAARYVPVHVGVCIVAVFMDGYSFMMFAVGSAILGAWLVAVLPSRRRWLLALGLPAHVMGLGIAYGLYTLYIGKPQFEPSQLDFFRGWGVDLTFLLAPSAGVHWLADLLGWSLRRSTAEFFGDSSVWRTTFSLPVVAGAAWALWVVVPRAAARPLALGLLLVAGFGFYMALGPSFKVNSQKPQDVAVGPLMPAEYAVAPTGTALLSAHLPGFNNMRAAYRWQALGAFSAWALLLLAASQRQPKVRGAAAVVLSVIALINLPDLPRKLGADQTFRSKFFEIDAQLVAPMIDDVQPGERVVFLPWHNDFLANYLAARLDVAAFNIGGDKNLAEARAHWPATLQQFPRATVDGDFSSRLTLMLARNEADVAVLPYLDLLQGAHEWPPPLVRQEALVPALEDLATSPYLTVQQRPLYAVVRLKDGLRDAPPGDLAAEVLRGLCLPPECLKRDRFTTADHSRIGTLEHGTLATSARAGFLHFGPYVPMRAGRYLLVVRGSADRVHDSWVDVTSDTGRVRHLHLEVVPHSTADGVLMQAELILDRAVDDLEVRLHVGAQDRLVFEGYQLTPADSTAEVSEPADADLRIHPG